MASRNINLQNAVNQLLAGSPQDFDGIYFAVLDKMTALKIEPVRKPAVRPNGESCGANQRGLLDYVAGCGEVNAELSTERQAEVLAEEVKALQSMRWVLDNRYSLSGYTPSRAAVEPEVVVEPQPLT